MYKLYFLWRGLLAKKDSSSFNKNGLVGALSSGNNPPNHNDDFAEITFDQVTHQSLLGLHRRELDDGCWGRYSVGR